MSGFVYLICDPERDYYKIGVTRQDIEKRIKKLQTGNGTELHLITYYKTEYPFKLERLLHAKYKYKKVLNEWFELSAEDVFNFKDTCQKTENMMMFLLEHNPFFS